jgi:hypothetical protein
MLMQAKHKQHDIFQRACDPVPGPGHFVHSGNFTSSVDHSIPCYVSPRKLKRKFEIGITHAVRENNNNTVKVRYVLNRIFKHQ